MTTPDDPRDTTRTPADDDFRQRFIAALDQAASQPSATRPGLFDVMLDAVRPELDRLRARAAELEAAPAEEPQDASAVDTGFQGAELARAQDGSYTWRCNGGQGCEGWVGLGHITEASAWEEFRHHVEREHRPAAPAEETAPEAPAHGDRGSVAAWEAQAAVIKAQRSRMDRALAALSRVWDLHSCDEGRCGTCTFRWPCGTVRALSEVVWTDRRIVLASERERILAQHAGRRFEDLYLWADRRDG